MNSRVISWPFVRLVVCDWSTRDLWPTYTSYARVYVFSMRFWCRISLNPQKQRLLKIDLSPKYIHPCLWILIVFISLLWDLIFISKPSFKLILWKSRLRLALIKFLSLKYWPSPNRLPTSPDPGYHFCLSIGVATKGYIRNCFYSLIQQVCLIDPGYYLVNVAAHPNHQWRLIFYPYHVAKGTDLGNNTGFKHFDNNLDK